MSPPYEFGPLSSVMAQVDEWPVGSVAVAVLDLADGSQTVHGDVDRTYALASVTKLLSAVAVLLAVEEGAIDLDEPVAVAATPGSPPATVRHLLAHAGGLATHENVAIASVGARRIYSNAGYEAVARHVGDAVGMSFAEYLTAGVLEPLGMTATALAGSAAHGATASVRDLAVFADALVSSRVLHPSTLAAATTVAFPGLDGVVPGFGRQTPNDWGLGPELHGTKSPHWMAPGSSPATYGHFGRAGTYLWVDPVARVACACLTDEPFGPWAVHRWPAFNASVSAAVSRTRSG